TILSNNTWRYCTNLPASFIESGDRRNTMSVAIFPNQSATLTEAVQALQQQMRGQVILPSHPEYDQARRVWNGMIDKYPALIAQCTGVADVIAAVNFAREHDLLVAVRGGVTMSPVMRPVMGAWSLIFPR